MQLSDRDDFVFCAKLPATMGERVRHALEHMAEHAPMMYHELSTADGFLPSYVLDANGDPLLCTRAQSLAFRVIAETMYPDPFRVARSLLGRHVMVSTVFLPVPLMTITSEGDAEPRPCWETKVFGGVLDDFTFRYFRRDHVMEGHVVALALAKLALANAPRKTKKAARRGLDGPMTPKQRRRVLKLRAQIAAITAEAVRESPSGAIAMTIREMAAVLAAPASTPPAVVH